MKLRKRSTSEPLTNEPILNRGAGARKDKTPNTAYTNLMNSSTPEIKTRAMGNPNARKTTKFKPEIIDLIMENAPTHSTRQLAELVKQKFGVSIHNSSIAIFLKERRAERAEVTITIVQDYLGKTIPKDLQILEEVRDQLNDMRKRRKEEHMTIGDLMAVIDRLRQVIDTRLKYAGADEGGAKSKLEDWMV